MTFYDRIQKLVSGDLKEFLDTRIPPAAHTTCGAGKLSTSQLSITGGWRLMVAVVFTWDGQWRRADTLERWIWSICWIKRF
jgi:hypothetical protein